MAGAVKQSGGFTSKKEGDDMPVVPCKGWIDPCEFCEKRFSQWVPAEDEFLEKIPSKPGILMFALKSKNNTEVVTITVNPTNIQNMSYTELDNLRQTVSDKKSKVTKSVILVRWMVFKKPDDKDVCTLLAHWINFGVFPKYMRSWPGESYLKESHYLVYSAKIQKWCYPKRDPVWKKTKPEPVSKIEIVEKCNFFDTCSYCDDYFTEWRLLDEVVTGYLAPEESGIIMYSVKYKKKREVIYIDSDPKNITVNICSSIKQRKDWIEHIANSDKFINTGNSSRGIAEVRWMTIRNPNDENSCLMYAHWLNAETQPMLNADSSWKLPGEKVLERTKQFVLRTKDQKWGYELFAGKPNRFSKTKNKREIMNEMEEELSMN